MELRKVNKFGVSGSMLMAAQSAEASLKRRESDGLEHALPPGHPLASEVEKQKALLGDLGGLPPGHPLLAMLQQAKERYEGQQEQKGVEQSKVRQFKKVKKIDEKRAATIARRKEEEEEESYSQSAKTVDAGLSSLLSEVRKLYETLSENEEKLNNDPMSRVKVSRMKRLLFATEHGLSGCNIVKVRA